MSLEQNLRDVLSNIKKEKERSSFKQNVQLIAVTKTHPFSLIEECYDAGITAIGENRIQEASKKFRSFDSMPHLSKRFIGHLQSNKVNKCLELFDTIDSVDSVKLLKRISNTASHQERTIHVLLEINTSGETQKHGFPPDQLNEIHECFNIPNIKIEGFMTVGPLTIDKELSLIHI